MKLSSFYDRLNVHDWFYDYSDDHRVWARGCADRAELRAIAMSSPAHRSLYNEFSAHVFRKTPIPARPQD